MINSNMSPLRICILPIIMLIMTLTLTGCQNLSMQKLPPKPMATVSVNDNKACNTSNIKAIANDNVNEKTNDTTNPANDTYNQAIQCLTPFAIQGKIGIKTNEQSGSAFFTWVQNQDQYDIQLSGALGIGATQITGNATAVQITNKDGVTSDSDPEVLLRRTTGWTAPIKALPFWMMGQPSPFDTAIHYDDTKRLANTDIDDWHTEFFYTAENDVLPSRLIVTSTTTVQPIRVVLALNKRQ